MDGVLSESNIGKQPHLFLAAQRRVTYSFICSLIFLVGLLLGRNCDTHSIYGPSTMVSDSYEQDTHRS
jgi:hypothetical protein